MRRGRAVAMLLAALDSHYLPNISGVITSPDEWFEQDPHFDLRERLLPFGLDPETIASTAEALLFARTQSTRSATGTSSLAWRTRRAGRS